MRHCVTSLHFKYFPCKFWRGDYIVLGKRRIVPSDDCGYRLSNILRKSKPFEYLLRNDCGLFRMPVIMPELTVLRIAMRFSYIVQQQRQSCRELVFGKAQSKHRMLPHVQMVVRMAMLEAYHALQLGNDGQ